MAKLRVHCFSISLDGYGAGPDQSLEHPLGVGGEQLHERILPTRTFKQMQGKTDGTTGCTWLSLPRCSARASTCSAASM